MCSTLTAICVMLELLFLRNKLNCSSTIPKGVQLMKVNLQMSRIYTSTKQIENADENIYRDDLETM